MKTKRIKVGIIGVGGIANGKHMPNLAKLDNVEMVAFCDLIEERAKRGASTYGTPDARVYTDYKELLENEDEVDVVHVCTTNDAHSFITIDALNAGKHVMCEKPMAKTSEEARAMVEAARKNKRKLTIGYQNRFRTNSLHLKKICDQGVLGEIYFAKALAIRRRGVPTWGSFLDLDKQGGGPLIDIGTHALDLTLWLMQNYEPEVAMGSTFQKLGTKGSEANPWGSWDPTKFEVEDSAFGFVRFRNGATVILEASWALNTLQTGEATCVLCGTEAGADMVGGLRINGEELGRLYTKTPDLDVGGVDFFAGKKASPGELEAHTWIQSVVEDKSPLVKPEEALVVTEILEGIYKSSASGKPYYF